MKFKILEQARVNCRKLFGGEDWLAGSGRIAVARFALILAGLIITAQAVELEDSDYILSFDGHQDYIEIPHRDSLNPEEQNWTLEFWVKLLDDFSIGHSKFVAKRDGSGSAGGFYVGSRFAPACSHGNRQNLDFRNAIETNQWTHVAVQIDREENKLRAYVNGKMVAESDSQLTGSVNPGSALRIGGDTTGPLQANYCLLRELRVWRGVNLTEKQISQNMNRKLTGQEEGLQGYWPLDEGSGSIAKDLAQGNDGTFNGNPRWRMFRPFLVDLEPTLLDSTKIDGLRLGPVELRDPTGDVTYQWFLNRQPIPGANQAILELDQIGEPDLGTYYLKVDDEREGTPVFSQQVSILKPDWPMWRFDAARSGETAVDLADDLHLQWQRDLGPPSRAWARQWDDRGKLDFDLSYSPVVAGELIFVPSSLTDSVTAYSIEDGSERWRFYTDGPVRLAPAVWRDRVFFGSDDGVFYCVEANTGRLIWEFAGGPSNQRLLGNERIISFWPVRGGPVIKAGKVYFAAGIWPLHGVFIYALDAESGDLVWVNDTTSSDYVSLPHGGAEGFGGLAPQGYIAASEEQLVVGGGRTMPAFLNRQTGAFEEAQFRASKGAGGYAVHAVDGGGTGLRRNRMLQQRVDSLEAQIEGEVFNKLAARDRLFVTTRQGKLYCFGPQPVEPVEYAREISEIEPRTGAWAEVADSLLTNLGETGGYALMLGAGSGDLLRELLLRSQLHIVVVEADRELAERLRDELAGAGLYGRRAAVIGVDPATFLVQPYLFSLVLSENTEDIGIAGNAALLARYLDRLRPYGGLAWLGRVSAPAERLYAALEQSSVDQIELRFREGRMLARRSGPLSGAGQWTHQHHDPANTLLSKDNRVRLPLGILWFGGPGNDNILPRHSGGPRPQVAGGRQVFLGVESISARCVYTGRPLWEQEFPGIGHPFTNLSLERRWQGGRQVYMTNIPGATYIGSPFVTLPDAVYLRYQGSVYRLDPMTGETTGKITPPGRPVTEIYEDEEVPDWGHLSIQGDYLITTSEPHIFEDQDLGWTNSYSGTSSRRLAVIDRHSGALLWELEANLGFRHNAIISNQDTLFVIDGLSENAVGHLARRGREPEQKSKIMALDLHTGRDRWRTDSEVFGTFLIYSRENDILIEGGSQDLRRRLGDEPRRITARSAVDGQVIWEGGRFVLPGALRGEMLIPGRPGNAISILTGENWLREQPLTGSRDNWSYRRRYGCNTLNASQHFLFYRTGYAGYFDLEHDSGTGNFGGFRSGCTPNLIAADGVLNALDYTRTCTCNYAHQTSLAMIHMPDDSNLESWTRYDAASPDPRGHGINFGAPGRRVDVAGSGRVWHHHAGTHRRHPSAIRNHNGGLDWVLASVREFDSETTVRLDDLVEREYRVILYFAELDEQVEPGQRRFDLLIDGEPVLENFDVVAEAGGSLNGVTREFTVNSQRRIQLELRANTDSRYPPIINGVELVQN